MPRAHARLTAPQPLFVCPLAGPGVVAIGLAIALLGPVRVSAQVVQPGAPGQPARVISTAEAVAHAGRPPSAADVQFMQDMIGHHAQALEMTALARTRTADAGVLALAARIDTSQRDEIG